jgi:hypothetical protein
LFPPTSWIASLSYGAHFHIRALAKTFCVAGFGGQSFHTKSKTAINALSQPKGCGGFRAKYKKPSELKNRPVTKKGGFFTLGASFLTSYFFRFLRLQPPIPNIAAKAEPPAIHQAALPDVSSVSAVGSSVAAGLSVAGGSEGASVRVATPSSGASVSKAAVAVAGGVSVGLSVSAVVLSVAAGFSVAFSVAGAVSLTVNCVAPGVIETSAVTAITGMAVSVSSEAAVTSATIVRLTPLSCASSVAIGSTVLVMGVGGGAVYTRTTVGAAVGEGDASETISKAYGVGDGVSYFCVIANCVESGASVGSMV